MKFSEGRGRLFALGPLLLASLIQRQQRILIDAPPLALRLFREEERREENGEGKADEDGNGEDFHESESWASGGAPMLME